MSRPLIFMLAYSLSLHAYFTRIPEVCCYSSPPCPFSNSFIHVIVVFFSPTNYKLVGLELRAACCCDCCLWCIGGGASYPR
jgi:hypothetical protein